MQILNNKLWHDLFFWVWCWWCSTICLMVTERRVHGSGGRSLWWSSVLSSHITGCSCPGGGEAHLRQCAGPSELFYAGISSWEWCSSHTRRWCSQSGCSPQCNCLRIFELRPNFVSRLRKKRRWWAFLTTDRVWIVQVRSSVMFTVRNLMLLTRSTGVPSMVMGGAHWSASWNPPPAPWSYWCSERGCCCDTS